MRTSEEIKAEIEARFGFFPPFFAPALDSPSVLENLWQQTLSAYINNPLPALFKETLFAWLSRFCRVPYCIICHSCALRPLGMKAKDILNLLENPSPVNFGQKEELFNEVEKIQAPIATWPEPGSQLEKFIFLCAICIFLDLDHDNRGKEKLSRLLDPVSYANLVTFLSYVKTCHLWVETHPGIAYEADKRAQEYLSGLLEEEPMLSDFFDNYKERINRESLKRERQLISEVEDLIHMKELLRINSARLSEAQHIAHIGNWEWNIQTNKIYGSDEMYHIYGEQPDKNGVTCETFLQYVHPDDRELLKKTIEDSICNNKPCYIDYRIIRSDGAERTIHAIGIVSYDEEGRAVRMAGTNQDITELKQQREVRMDAPVRLAGEIVHDLNNVLTGILGYSNILQLKMENGDPLKTHADNIYNAAKRAADLTANLLTLSRKQIDESHPANNKEAIHMDFLKKTGESRDNS